MLLENLDPNQITLRTARKIRGFTIIAAAAHVRVTPRTMRKYEGDSGKTPYDTIVKLLQLYRFPFKSIYIGKDTSIKTRSKSPHNLPHKD